MIRIIGTIFLTTLVRSTKADSSYVAVRVRSEGTSISNTCIAGGLNNVAHAYGKYFGTATAVNELADQGYSKILNNWANFGQITPVVGMKWAEIQPRPGEFDFSAGDTIVKLAHANGQLLRCHALVWYQDLPYWVTNGQWNRQSLIAALWTHITTVVNHYKSTCYAWDVVNEALAEDGSLHDNIFLNVIGPAYISISFQAAAAADPNAKLYYNDYNIDNDFSQAPPAPSPASQRRNLRRKDIVRNHPRQSQVYNKIDGAKFLANMVRAQGARIDGIGLQGHYVYNATPSVDTLLTILNGFAAMNLDVAFTELDIRMDLSNINDHTTALQAQGYANIMAACRDVERCVGITLWDFADRYSWVPSFFSNYGSALPWDSNLVPKKQIIDGMIQAYGCDRH